MENLFPISEKLNIRQQKEAILNQKGVVLWLTGLSCSGKSSIACQLERKLTQKGFICTVLDGDNIRAGLNTDLNFSEQGRSENIRRAAEVAKVLSHSGIITICSLITPTEESRNTAKSIIGDDFHLVYINCPLEICEERDTKGLYKKAKNGEIKDFTGIGSPFEKPINYHIKLDTNEETLEESVSNLLSKTLSIIKA